MNQEGEVESKLIFASSVHFDKSSNPLNILYLPLLPPEPLNTRWRHWEWNSKLTYESKRR